jgi:AraC-like DNA-binding protein
METRHLEFVDAMLRRIVELRTDGVNESAEMLFGSLLQELMREEASASPAALSGISRLHVETMHRLARAIRESPGQPWSVAELAKAAGYHVDHFSRVFRHVMGLGPQRFIIDAKMDRARQLLAESEFTVGQIADVLGFENRHFFSRQFLQHNACTPSVFREKTARTKFQEAQLAEKRRRKRKASSF